MRPVSFVRQGRLVRADLRWRPAQPGHRLRAQSRERGNRRRAAQGGPERGHAHSVRPHACSQQGLSRGPARAGSVRARRWARWSPGWSFRPRRRGESSRSPWPEARWRGADKLIQQSRGIGINPPVAASPRPAVASACSLSPPSRPRLRWPVRRGLSPPSRPRLSWRVRRGLSSPVPPGLPWPHNRASGRWKSVRAFTLPVS